ncbi:MAG: 3-phosphoserine/phosphohydroxythreonine transaminase [Actinomycetota bacterium]
MTERSFNFSAGPATLPLPVLEEAQRDLIALPGVGAGPLEVSHRGAWFRGVIDEAEANLRLLLAIPATHRVLFCQGGATQQFSMVAMNFLRGTGRPAEYVLTGAWGNKAFAEAQKEGTARVAWTGAGDGFVSVPTADELVKSLSRDAAYAHVTTNETIQGVEFAEDPHPPADVPLVADMSSDFCSRPVDVGRYGAIYAGAQKNAGPAGVTVVIVRDDMLARIPDGLPTMLDYRTFADHGSLYNTPPVFSIYVLMLVTRWLRDDVGGLEAQRANNRAKAGLVYDAIDASGGFYLGHARPEARSLMNLTWRLPSEALDQAFVSEAADEGMAELKGHRSVGGIRASLYNAMPLEGPRTLAEFMRGFAARHA